MYGVRDFFQPVTVFPRESLQSFLHGNGVFVWSIGGKKDAIGRAGHKRHKADDNYNAECHADACDNGRDKAAQTGEKMPDGRAHRRSGLTGVGGGFLHGKLHLAGAGLHLGLSCYVPHSFICGGAQLALALGHAANVARSGFGGVDLFLCPLVGQIRPTVRARLCVGQRATPCLFGAYTALTGGVGAGGFDLLCGVPLPVFFDLLAGKLATLLHGEIGILLDSGMGCIGHHPAGVVGRGIVAISLRRGTFPQFCSTFFLGLCPRLFQRRFRNFSRRITFRRTLGWLFFYLFHGILPVINYSNRISKSFKRLLNSAHKWPL